MTDQPSIEGLVAALALTESEGADGVRAFVGTTQPCPWPKAYGGDMVAQAAVAAMRTAGDDRVLHSMHSYFMRPVDIGREVRYEVETLRDGRGYSTRQVRGLQDGKVAYVCLASFHVPEEGGPEFAPLEPPRSRPDDLPTSEAVLAGVQVGTPEAGMLTDEAKAYYSRGRSFDMRHVPGSLYTASDFAGSAGADADGQSPADGPADQGVWVRAYRPLDAPAPGLTLDQTHLAALAYVCDYTIIEPTLRAVGMPWAQPGLMTASLDHAMWFHRPVRVDDWLFYAQEAVAAQDGRGLGLGRFRTPDGTLVATVCQEAAIRPRR